MTKDFWHDHHLMLRRLIGERTALYIPLHIVICFVVMAMAMPVLGFATVSGQEIGGLVGFLAYAVAILGLFLAIYILIFLPVRVCGNDDLAGYLCIALTFVLPWFFL